MILGLQHKEEVIDFVEFNITGDSENYNRCDNESLYLNTNIFNIYVGCFERSNHLFDFTVPTMYNSRKFIPLINELALNLKDLLSINNIEQFRKYLKGVFLGDDLIKTICDFDPDYENNWRTHMRKLIQINRHIMRLIDTCIEEERTLWIIPY